MDFNAIKAVIEDDFNAVNQFIIKHLNTQVPLIHEVSDYIVSSGGKRLRPMVALLAARATGYTGQQHVNIAAIIELLHTSTLLHDDVVDESNLRRKKPTVNAVWGNQAAILVGDFMISRAYQLTVEMQDMRLLEILAEGTNIISEGEVLQMLNCHDPSTTEENYMRVIHAKTAKMFESAAEAGAILAAHTEQEAENNKSIMGAYARHLGIAFQLIDDVLDYQSSAEEMGKNVGDDLAEGKPTLPLIHTIANGTKDEAELIKQAIRHGGIDQLGQIIDIVQSSGGIEYTIQKAEEHAQLAIDAISPLDSSEYKVALSALAKLAVHRDH